MTALRWLTTLFHRLGRWSFSATFGQAAAMPLLRRGSAATSSNHVSKKRGRQKLAGLMASGGSLAWWSPAVRQLPDLLTPSAAPAALL
eukprot:1548252-Pyramimonas_sp.AAC.1